MTWNDDRDVSCNEVNPLVSNSANNALNSLASFLDYVECSKSSEQVRNFRDILENILLIEQREKLVKRASALSLKIENCLWTSPPLNHDG
jgi:hypothetical protein